MKAIGLTILLLNVIKCNRPIWADAIRAAEVIAMEVLVSGRVVPIDGVLSVTGKIDVG